MNHIADPVSPEQINVNFVPTAEKTKGNKIKELFKKADYRRKLQLMLWICLVYVTLGLVFSQKGPSFLDLQLITDVNVEKGSAYFTSSSVGYVLGSFVGGILLDMFNKKIIMFFSVITMGSLTISIPWCVEYWWMVAFQFLVGVFGGVVDTGGNAVIARLWGNRVKRYMQTLHFMFAFGSVISSMVTKPFLATEHENSTHINGGIQITESTVVNTSTPINLKVQTQPSLLYIPFSISGSLTVLSAIPLLFNWCYERKRLRKQDSKDSLCKDTNNLPTLPFRLKLVTLYLVGQLFLFYTSIEGNTAGFLVTFVVRQLDWSKQKGADLTTLFWGIFALGRLTGVFVVSLLHSVKLLLLCCTCIAMSYIGLYLGTIFYSEPVIWFFTGLAGGSMSFVYPCIFTWTEEDIVCVSAKISSFFIIMSAGGSTVTPILMGSMMERYTAMSFLYVLFTQAVFLLVTLILLWLLLYFKIDAIKKAQAKQQKEAR